MERNRNGGFTLLETLLAVAILAILLGVSAVGVAYHKDYLKATELDNIARDIYMAAENRAVLLQNSGASATLLSLGGSGDVVLSKTATQLNDLLPKGTIDPVLWDGERDFRVVYDQATGHVKEVFYAEKAIDGNLYDFRGTRTGRVNLFRGGRTLVGYYGSDVVDPIVTKPLPTPGVEVLINNGEELTVTVTYTLPEGVPLDSAGTAFDGDCEYSIELKYEGTTPATTIDLMDARFLSRRKPPVGSLTKPGDSLSYTWVLDSLEKDAGGDYPKQFKGLVSSDLGGDFTVTAGLKLSCSGWVDSAYYAEGTDNSLFAKETGNGPTAYIANLRHLQNLGASIFDFASGAYFATPSGYISGVGPVIKHSKQSCNIDCGTYKGNPYSFLPIQNEYLTSYDGQKYELRGLKVDVPGQAGLFGTVVNVDPTQMMTFKAIRLIEPNVTSRRLDAGSLVGAIGNRKTGSAGMAGNVTIEDVWAVDATVTAARTDADLGAGGLVGWMFPLSPSQCVIKNSRVFWTDSSQLVNSGTKEIEYKITGTVAGGLVGGASNGFPSGDLPADAKASKIEIENSFAATTLKANLNSSHGWTGVAGGLIGSVQHYTQALIRNSYADVYMWGGRLNGGLIGLVRDVCANLDIENSYAAGFIVQKGMSSGADTAGLYGFRAMGSGYPGTGTDPKTPDHIENVYSVVRVLKADGTLEKPAKPLYNTAAGDGSGNVRYLFMPDEVTPKLFGEAFEYTDADNSPETHIYNLRYKLSGKAEEALEKPYPYPGLKDTTGAPIPHYGDWAVWENKAAVPAGLAYYEVYKDIASPGVWGVLEDGTALQDLKDDTDNPVVTKDGYALVFEGTEVPENYKVQYGAASTQTWTLKNLKWENGSDTQDAEKLTAPTGGKTYTLIPLPDKVVTKAWEGITQYSKFYQKMVCGEGAAARTYWFNPHFAKTVKKSDSAPAEPSDSSSSAIIVRTPRHFWHMSAIRYDDHVEHQFYPAKYNYTYKQELDLDYGSYEGYPGVFAPKAGELPFKQLPIGSGYDWVVLQGTYDGGYHTIRNVLFNKKELQHIGLFGVSSGTLKNIIYQMDPTTEHTAGMRANGTYNHAGMLLAFNNGGVVENCAVYGANMKTILTNYGNKIVLYNHTGGLVGNNKGTIRNCSAEVVHLQAESTGNSSFTGGFVGGLVGMNNGTISSCYAVGKMVSKESDIGVTAGLVGQNSSGGKIINSYAAANLECRNAANKYGLFKRYNNDSEVDDVSGWLKGTFRYRGEEYKVDDDTYKGAGTAITPAELAAKLPALAAAANTVKNFPGSWPGGKNYSADYTGSFPYLTGVTGLARDEDGKITGAAAAPIHYGLWPVERLTLPGLAYYETYGSGASRTYGVEGVLADGTEIKELTETPPSLDGYALIFKGKEADIRTPLTVTYQGQTQTYTLRGTTGNLYWAASASAPSGENVKAVSYKQKDTEEEYTLVPLPAEIVTGLPGDRTTFYQKLSWTVNGNTKSFWFNPHFAKTVHMEQPAEEPTTEASAASVRTPRHFWNLGAISYELSNSTYQIYRDYRFKQELDLDFKKYDTDSVGINLQNYTPIGCETVSAFGGVYDGQGHSIQNLGSGTGDQFVSYANPFGYSKGALKNIVYHMNAFDSSKMSFGTLSRVGGLVGDNMTEGVVESCRVRIASGEVINGTNMLSLGGLVGQNQGAIKNSRVTSKDTPENSAEAVTLNAVRFVGGLHQTLVGGLVGTNEGGAITFDNSDGYSATIGELTNQSFYATAGGVVGENKGGKDDKGQDVEGLMYGWTVRVGDLSGSGYMGGLVGKNGDGGKVNECVVNVTNLTSPKGSSCYIGGLAGFNGVKGTIESCMAVVENLLKEEDQNKTVELGGLVGENKGKIAKCHALVTGGLTNKGSIGTGAYIKVGGLAGFNCAGGAIEDCAAQVNALTNTGRYARVGGAVGQNDGAIRDTVTTVNTTLTNKGEKAYVGGLAGVNNTNGAIEKCTVTVNGPLTNDSSGSAYVGGVAGENSSGATVTDCMVKLTDSLTNTKKGEEARVGGAAGQNNGTIRDNVMEITTLTNSGQSAYVGGAAGENSSGATVTDCTVTVIDSLTNNGRSAYVGGVAGQNNGTIQGTSKGKCSATVTTLTNNNASARVGGVVGYNVSTNTIMNCAATVDTLTNSGGMNTYVGGLIGSNYGSTVENCEVVVSKIVNNGDWSSVAVGGLIGEYYQVNGTVSACTVNVTELDNKGGSDSKVGGLVGNFKDGTVNQCQAVVFFLSNKEGGYVGVLSGSDGGTFTNCTPDVSTPYAKNYRGRLDRMPL